MALSLDQKKTVVAEVSAVAQEAVSAVAAEYRGLTVTELTELRKNARDMGVFLRVVKNTLARKAVDGTEFECMKEGLLGPLILGFSTEEPGAAARVFKDFSKEHERLIPKIGAIGGRVYSANDLDRLAALPNRNQALSLLMAVMKAPVEKFVRTLAEPHSKLVRTVAAIRDQKQAA